MLLNSFRLPEQSFKLSEQLRYRPKFTFFWVAGFSPLIQWGCTKMTTIIIPKQAVNRAQRITKMVKVFDWYHGFNPRAILILSVALCFFATLISTVFFFSGWAAILYSALVCLKYLWSTSCGGCYIGLFQQEIYTYQIIAHTYSMNCSAHTFPES